MLLEYSHMGRTMTNLKARRNVLMTSEKETPTYDRDSLHKHHQPRKLLAVESPPSGFDALWGVCRGVARQFPSAWGVAPIDGGTPRQPRSNNKVNT
jgi:hypothetical protein